MAFNGANNVISARQPRTALTLLENPAVVETDGVERIELDIAKTVHCGVVEAWQGNGRRKYPRPVTRPEAAANGTLKGLGSPSMYEETKAGLLQGFWASSFLSS